jgi:hypothetical protein
MLVRDCGTHLSAENAGYTVVFLSAPNVHLLIHSFTHALLHHLNSAYDVSGTRDTGQTRPRLCHKKPVLSVWEDKQTGDYCVL